MITKRIAFIGDLGSDYRTGGGYTFAVNCLHILQEHLDLHVDCYIPVCQRIDKGTTPAPPNSMLINLPDAGLGKVWVLLPFIWKLYKKLRTPPNLYVFAQPLPWVEHLPPAPAVCMFHGPLGLARFSWKHPRSSLNNMIIRLWLEHTVKGFLKLRYGFPMFNSCYTLQMIAEWFSIDPNPLTPYVIYLPVDFRPYERLDNLRNTTRKELGIEEKEIVICYISNFAPKKRVHEAVKIAKEILHLYPQGVKFLFAGRPIASEALETFVADPSSRGKVIRFMEVPPSRVPALFAASDIAISTSKTETF